MAVSDEAIIHRLMFETMKVEKKEFEGQKRSNENDIILHRQRLAREHVSMLYCFSLSFVKSSTDVLSNSNVFLGRSLMIG